MPAKEGLFMPLVHVLYYDETSDYVDEGILDLGVHMDGVSVPTTKPVDVVQFYCIQLLLSFNHYHVTTQLRWYLLVVVDITETACL